MHPLIAIGRPADASANNTHLRRIFYSQRSFDICPLSEIHRGVRRNLPWLLILIEPRRHIQKAPPHPLRLLLSRRPVDGRLRREEQQVVRDVPIKLHTHVLRLEEQELHRRVVQHISDHPPIIRSHLYRSKSPVLAYHLHKHIPRKIE